MGFAERLKILRTKRGLTQRQLGSELFISERVISYYEQGERFPNDESTLIRIAGFFQVSADYLLGITDQRFNDTDSSYPEELRQLIEIYCRLNSNKQGRILQFAIDLENG